MFESKNPLDQLKEKYYQLPEDQRKKTVSSVFVVMVIIFTLSPAAAMGILVAVFSIAGILAARKNTPGKMPKTNVEIKEFPAAKKPGVIPEDRPLQPDEIRINGKIVKVKKTQW